MAMKESRESCIFKSASPPDVHLLVHGRPYCLNRNLLIARSGKLTILLEEHQHEELSYSLPDIPGDWKTFELAMSFCYGFEPNLSSENVVPLICLAYFLDMTETHSPNNLLNKTRDFFQFKVLPIWNQSVKAYQTTELVIQQAVHLHLVDACLNSLLGMARLDPRLLGEPIGNPTHIHDTDGDSDGYRPNARRRLFVLDPEWQSEDYLTILTLQLYEIIMSKMIQGGVPSEYVAGSLFRYTEKWAHVGIGFGGREVIETVEKLLPDNRDLILPCKLLFEMLRSAVILQASSNCRNGLEIRIGKQLNEATVEDLLIPSEGYDIECVKRILKTFYANYTSSDTSGLIKVAELIDEFLAEVASDVDLNKDTFISLAQMSIATSVGTKRSSDGIYRAINVYLDNHRYLTESERDEVCQVLDCHNMSPEACTHAAQNERLPLWVVVQALFVGQLQLRDAIASRISEEEEVLMVGEGDEEARIKMERMDSRVMVLERECCIMRRQIEKDGGVKNKKKKVSVWKALKTKLGCIGTRSVHEHERAAAAAEEEGGRLI